MLVCCCATNEYSEITFFLFFFLFKNFKAVRPLRVDETELNLRNTFIVNLFALGGEEESKYEERTFF